MHSAPQHAMLVMSRQLTVRLLCKFFVLLSCCVCCHREVAWDGGRCRGRRKKRGTLEGTKDRTNKGDCVKLMATSYFLRSGVDLRRTDTQYTYVIHTQPKRLHSCHTAVILFVLRDRPIKNFYRSSKSASQKRLLRVDSVCSAASFPPYLKIK